MPHLIAIDIGTTYCKAVILDTAGKVFHSCKTGYPLLQDTEGQSEQNPEQIFEAFLSVLRQALEAGKTLSLLGISFSAAMHSLIAINAYGQPLTQAITWADTRSKPYAEALLLHPDADRIFAHTGTPIHSMSPLCKLVWLRETQPALFRQAHKFISIKEYVFFRLFGKYLVDDSIASATGLYHQATLSWYPPALQAAGITAAQLSTPVRCTHAESVLLPVWQKTFALPAALPFFIGASDGCLANLGCGAVLPGEAAITIGTSGAVRVISQQALPDAQKRLFRYLLTDRLFVVGGPTNNGGIALQWLAENILHLPMATDTAYQELFQLADTVPAGAEQLLFLPYLLGERAPIWDAGAKAVFFGLQHRHTRAHLVRAVLEGILFALTEVLETLEATSGNIEYLYASGGFTHSPFWLQLLADISGKQIVLTEGADASAIGAAMLAMYALELIPEPLAVKPLLPPTHLVQPNQSQYQLYRPYFRLYQSLYPTFQNGFRQLSAL